jgi:hypothetical protein
VLLTAAAFVIRHLNVAIANMLQPVAFGHRPFRLRSTEGLFGDHGRYHDGAEEIEDEFAEYFPARVHVRRAISPQVHLAAAEAARLCVADG